MINSRFWTKGLKNVFVILSMIQTALCVSAQGTMPSCSAGDLCVDVIGNLSPQQLSAVSNNWTDFSGYDLNFLLPAECNGKSLQTFDIKVDGMGCVLPFFFNDSSIRELFLAREMNDNCTTKCTIYSLLRKYGHVRSRFKLSLEGEDLVSFQQIEILLDKEKVMAEDYFYFRDSWNKIFLSRLLSELNSFSKKNGISKCIMFIGGYNVPYSLMHLQANRIFNEIAQRTPNTANLQQTVFIRWIWPSFYFKNCETSGNTCDIDNQRSKKVGLISAFGVNNRAYFSGLTLRKFLNDIDSNIRVGIITHSLGSTIAAASLINPFSKMKHLSSAINSQFYTYFTGETVPTNDVTIFMNAPSMPGQSTFVSIDAGRALRQKYLIGMNEYDDMLQKKVFKSFILSGIRLPAYLSSTTLGCNRKSFWSAKREVQRTIEALPSALRRNFTFYTTGVQRTHDIYCYLKQNEFQHALDSFVNEME